MQAKVESQVMADLPECRLAPLTPPFYYTSCDYFGPYNVKIRHNKTTKYYFRKNWNVGRIVEVYPGQDGKVRNVRVKTRTGEYQRPITKIAVIQPAEVYA